MAVKVTALATCFLFMMPLQVMVEPKHSINVSVFSGASFNAGIMKAYTSVYKRVDHLFRCQIRP